MSSAITKFNNFYNSSFGKGCQKAIHFGNNCTKAAGFVPLFSALIGPERVIYNLAAYILAPFILKFTKQECLQFNFDTVSTLLYDYKKSCVKEMKCGLKEMLSIKLLCFVVPKIVNLINELQLKIYVAGDRMVKEQVLDFFDQPLQVDRRHHSPFFEKISNAFHSPKGKKLQKISRLTDFVIHLLGFIPIVSAPIGLGRVFINIGKSIASPITLKCTDSSDDIKKLTREGMKSRLQKYISKRSKQVLVGVSEALSVKGIFLVAKIVDVIARNIFKTIVWFVSRKFHTLQLRVYNKLS